MSSKSYKKMILQYLISRGSELQADNDRNLRILEVRRSDEIDILELLISHIRLQAFQEFSADILQILRIIDIDKK